MGLLAIKNYIIYKFTPLIATDFIVSDNWQIKTESRSQLSFNI